MFVFKWISLSLSCLELSQLHKVLGLCLLPNFGNLQSLFPWMLFIYILSPVLQDSDNMNGGSFAVVLTGLWASFFFPVYFLVPKLGNFYCYILKFIDFFIWPLHPVIEPTHYIFNFSYCILSLKFPFGPSLYLFFFFFHQDFISFHFFQTLSWLLSETFFMMVALKYLSDHSMICVIGWGGWWWWTPGSL